jgi:hypothetical protein
MLLLKCIEREQEQFVEYPHHDVQFVFDPAYPVTTSAAAPSLASSTPNLICWNTTAPEDMLLSSVLTVYFIVARRSGTSKHQVTVEVCSVLNRDGFAVSGKLLLANNFSNPLSPSDSITRIVVQANHSGLLRFSGSVEIPGLSSTEALPSVERLVTRPSIPIVLIARTLRDIISGRETVSVPKLAQDVFSLRLKSSAAASQPSAAAGPVFSSDPLPASGHVALDEEQSTAVNMILQGLGSNDASATAAWSIESGPGCGRTRVLSVLILELLRRHPGISVLCLGPNDRSAHHLADELANNISARELGVYLSETGQLLSNLPNSNCKLSSGNYFDSNPTVWQKSVVVTTVHSALIACATIKLQPCLVVIDDASHIWDGMLLPLLQFLPIHTRYVFAGDRRGLAPVILGSPVAVQNVLGRALMNPSVPRAMMSTIHRNPAHLARMVSSLFYETRLQWKDQSVGRATWYHNTSGTDVSAHLNTVVKLFRAEMQRSDANDVVILTLEPQYLRRLQGMMSECPGLVGRVFSTADFVGVHATVVLLYVPKLARSSVNGPASSSHQALLRYQLIQYACSRALQKLVVIGPRLSRRRSKNVAELPNQLSKKSLLHAIAYYVQQPHSVVLGLPATLLPTVSAPSPSAHGRGSGHDRQHPAAASSARDEFHSRDGHSGRNQGIATHVSQNSRYPPQMVDGGQSRRSFQHPQAGQPSHVSPNMHFVQSRKSPPAHSIHASPPIMHHQPYSPTLPIHHKSPFSSIHPESGLPPRSSSKLTPPNHYGGNMGGDPSMHHHHYAPRHSMMNPALSMSFHSGNSMHSSHSMSLYAGATDYSPAGSSSPSPKPSPSGSPHLEPNGTHTPNTMSGWSNHPSSSGDAGPRVTSTGETSLGRTSFYEQSSSMAASPPDGYPRRLSPSMTAASPAMGMAMTQTHASPHSASGLRSTASLSPFVTGGSSKWSPSSSLPSNYSQNSQYQHPSLPSPMDSAASTYVPSVFDIAAGAGFANLHSVPYFSDRQSHAQASAHPSHHSSSASNGYAHHGQHSQQRDGQQSLDSIPSPWAALGDYLAHSKSPESTPGESVPLSSSNHWPPHQSAHFQQQRRPPQHLQHSPPSPQQLQQLPVPGDVLMPEQHQVPSPSRSFFHSLFLVCMYVCMYVCVCVFQLFVIIGFAFCVVVVVVHHHS